VSATTCHTISYVALDRHVSTQCVYYETYSCACSHTKRRLYVHFLTYKVMPMRNFKLISPCLSHNFPQVQSKQSTTSQPFNLRTLLIMQFLTYKDVAVRKLSHVCNLPHNLLCFISTTMLRGKDGVICKMLRIDMFS